jgi:hypothetical protein
MIRACQRATIDAWIGPKGFGKIDEKGRATFKTYHRVRVIDLHRSRSLFDRDAGKSSRFRKVIQLDTNERREYKHTVDSIRLLRISRKESLGEHVDTRDTQAL